MEQDTRFTILFPFISFPRVGIEPTTIAFTIVLCSTTAFELTIFFHKKYFFFTHPVHKNMFTIYNTHCIQVNYSLDINNAIVNSNTSHLSRFICILWVNAGARINRFPAMHFRKIIALCFRRTSRK